MLQIKNTLGGGKPEGLYAWKKNEIGSELKELNESVSTLPYNFVYGSAVVLNGEIHILGGGSNSSSYKYHYKWDGISWISVSTLPYNFYYGSAVVLNNEIHILGGNGGEVKHYKWNGTSWTSVSTLPYSFRWGSAVVYNSEIHILGSIDSSSEYTNHYKFDGSNWTKVSTLPYNFYVGSAVVLNEEIHILGGNYSPIVRTNHYKWDGTSWTSVSTLPYSFYQGSAVVFDNDIHILGGNGYIGHYKWDGSNWTQVSTLSYEFYNGSAVVFDNAIHILGSGNSSYYDYHYLIIGYVPTYTFLDYIVSDKENAYPDGGEKGGYWYERVGESIPPYLFSDFDAEGYPATFKINTDIIPVKAFGCSADSTNYISLLSKITNLDIKANSCGAFAFSGGFYGNTQSLKIKIRVGTISSPMFDNVDKVSNIKAWLSNEVTSIDGYLADFANAGSFENTKIYCEVGSKPSGWNRNWNKRYLFTATYSTMWGVSESEFDAL